MKRPYSSKFLSQAWRRLFFKTKQNKTQQSYIDNNNKTKTANQPAKPLFNQSNKSTWPRITNFSISLSWSLSLISMHWSCCLRWGLTKCTQSNTLTGNSCISVVTVPLSKSLKLLLNTASGTHQEGTQSLLFLSLTWPFSVRYRTRRPWPLKLSVSQSWPFPHSCEWDWDKVSMQQGRLQWQGWGCLSATLRRMGTCSQLPFSEN